jgi:hypothetical protein
MEQLQEAGEAPRNPRTSRRTRSARARSRARGRPGIALMPNSFPTTAQFCIHRGAGPLGAVNEPSLRPLAYARGSVTRCKLDSCFRAARVSKRCRLMLSHLPWPAADALVGSSLPQVLISLANSGSRVTRADRGVRPTNSNEFPLRPKPYGIRHRPGSSANW